MKKFCFILMALLINFSLFAAPPDGGGRGKPDKEGPGGGREPAGGFPRGDRPSGPDRKNPPSDKGSKSQPQGKNAADRNMRETWNFRGQRIVLSDKVPEVLKADLIKKDDFTTGITLHFNQPIKAESLNGNSILIEKKPLPEETKFLFNKKADSVYFEVDYLNADSLELIDLEGINGKTAETVKVKL